MQFSSPMSTNSNERAVLPLSAAGTRASKQRRVTSAGKAIRTKTTSSAMSPSSESMLQGKGGTTASEACVSYANGLPSTSIGAGDGLSPSARVSPRDSVRSRTRRKRSFHRTRNDQMYKQTTNPNEKQETCAGICVGCALRELGGFPLVASPAFPHDWGLARRGAWLLLESGRCGIECNLKMGAADVESCAWCSDWSSILLAGVIQRSHNASLAEAAGCTYHATPQTPPGIITKCFQSFIYKHIINALEESCISSGCQGVSQQQHRQRAACGSVAAVPPGRLLELCCWLATLAPVMVQEFLASQHADFITKSLCSALNGSVKDVKLVSLAVACVVLIASRHQPRVSLEILTESNTLQFLKLLLNRCVYQNAAEQQSALMFSHDVSHSLDSDAEKSNVSCVGWQGSKQAMLAYLRSAMDCAGAESYPIADPPYKKAKVMLGGANISEDGLAALIALEELLRCRDATQRHGVAIVKEVMIFLQKWWPRIELTATPPVVPPGSAPPSASAAATAALLTVSSIARISEDVLSEEACFEPILAFIDSKLSAVGETRTIYLIVGMLRLPDPNVASASATLVGSSLGRLKLRRGAGQLAGLPAAALEVLDQVLQLIDERMKNLGRVLLQCSAEAKSPSANDKYDALKEDAATQSIRLTSCYSLIRIAKELLGACPLDGWRPHCADIVAVAAAAWMSSIRLSEARCEESITFERAFITDCIECIWRVFSCCSESTCKAIETTSAQNLIIEILVIDKAVSETVQEVLYLHATQNSSDTAAALDTWFRNVIYENSINRFDSAASRELIDAHTQSPDATHRRSSGYSLSATPPSPWNESSYTISHLAAQETTPMTARRHSAGEAEGKNQFCYSSSAEADATEQQISPIISVSPPCNGEQLIEPPEMRSLEAQFAGACKVVGGIIADASVELGENVSQDMLSPKESIQVSQNDHLELEAENAALRAELCAARRQIEEFIQSSAFAKEEIIKCSARNEALERKCAEHNDVISSSYAKLVAVVAELEDSRERLAAAEALTRSAADDAKIAQTRASESLLLFARSEALATEYMRQIDDLKAEASTGRAEYSVLELRLAEQERKSAIQQMKFASLEREMISKNAFADSLEARIRDYEGAIAILNRQISTLESDVHSRSVEVNVLRESEAALTRQSADMAASLTRIKARRNELRNLLDNERSESNELKNKLRSSENSIEELHSQIAGLVVSLEASRAEATAQRQLAVNLSQEVAKHKDVIMYINKISSESGRRNS